jgi:hypothetical protein
MRAMLPSREFMPLILLLILPGSVQASCGTDDCPIDLHRHQLLVGRFSFDASLQYIDQDEAQAGTEKTTIGALPAPETEVRTLSRIYSMTGRARITPRLGLTLSLPFVDREHQHIPIEGGVPGELADFRYSGLGDLLTTARWIALGADPAGGSSASIVLGIKLPTGERNVDEIDGEQPEPPVRPGTGSVDGIAGLHLSAGVGTKALNGTPVRAPLFLGLNYRVNGKGTEDYRVGDEFQANAGGEYPVSDAVDLLAQLNLRVRDRDDPGQTDALPDNTGGTWFYFTPGLRVRTGSRLDVFGYVQFPVYQRVNGIQLVSPYHLLFGTTVSLPH